MLQPQNCMIPQILGFKGKHWYPVHVHIGFIEKQRSGGPIVIYMLDYQSRGFTLEFTLSHSLLCNSCIIILASH